MKKIVAKKAKDKDEAWLLQERFIGQPHGWIQWKGTSVCMDVHCKCGKLLHIDAEFTYHIKCPHCNTAYFCNGHIELIELEIAPYGTILLERDDEED